MRTESTIFYQMSGWERLLFTAIPILAVLGLLASVGITFYRSAQISKQWRQDQAMLPTCIVATVLSKRTEANTQRHKKQPKFPAHTSGQSYASFAPMDGAPPLEFAVPMKTWTTLCEGSVGELCFRGRNFLHFTPDQHDKTAGEEDVL